MIIVRSCIDKVDPRFRQHQPRQDERVLLLIWKRNKNIAIKTIWSVRYPFETDNFTTFDKIETMKKGHNVWCASRNWAIFRGGWVLSCGDPENRERHLQKDFPFSAKVIYVNDWPLMMMLFCFGVELCMIITIFASLRFWCGTSSGEMCKQTPGLKNQRPASVSIIWN